MCHPWGLWRVPHSVPSVHGSFKHPGHKASWVGMGTSPAPSLPKPSANTQPFPLNGLEQHSQMRYVLFPKSQEATKCCNLSSMERGSRCNNCPSCKYILTRLITWRCKIPEAACPWISVGFPPNHWHMCVSPKCLREVATPIPRGRQCSGFEWGPVDRLEITVPEPWQRAEDGVTHLPQDSRRRVMYLCCFNLTASNVH